MGSDDFRKFEHAGWQAIPDKYHNAFGSLTSQAIGPLLDAVKVKRGLKLLDIASGPGYIAAAATMRGAVVFGIDFSGAMVIEARRLHPDLRFCVGDAEQLPLGNELFDAAVMNFGILHLGKPEDALREAYRVMRSGGRFAFTAWAKPEETVGFGMVLRAVERHGELRVGVPEGPPFFRFSDADECAQALRTAGFDNPKVTTIAQLWRLPQRDGLFDAMRYSTVRTAGVLRSQKALNLERIRIALRKESEKYRTGDMVELPMPAILATGVKK